MIGINSARYFLITKRNSDGAAVFWYKPNSAHQTLYPVKRNHAGEPEVRTFEGNNRCARDPLHPARPLHPSRHPALRFITDPNGIEIFNTVEGPTAAPTTLAPFGESKEKKPYLDPATTMKAISKLLDAHPSSFGSTLPVCPTAAAPHLSRPVPPVSCRNTKTRATSGTSGSGLSLRPRQ